MKTKYSKCILFLFVVLLMSCVENKSSNNEEESVWEEDLLVNQEKDYVNCPLCNATGIWTDPMTLIREKCSMCNGTGNALREEVEKAIETIEMMGLNGNSSLSIPGRNVDDIRRQIEMYNEQISRLQQSLDVDNSMVGQTFYSQEIIELKYKIRELENQLMNMQ